MSNNNYNVSNTGEKLRLLQKREDQKCPIKWDNSFTCVCGKESKVSDMLCYKDTGVLKNAISMLCKNCPNTARQKLARHARVFCVGCNEQIGFIEPGKEKKGGFVWAEGGNYHVPNCPQCQGWEVKNAPVLEKLVFYKQNNIPYSYGNNINN